mgnify:CR=1 FL=1
MIFSKLIEYYKKDSEQDLRNEMFELNKSSELAKKMQEKIIDETEVTPEEVRQFFNSIPKNDRPFFGTELKVAQIVVIPKTTEEEKKKVIDRLKEFKADVEDNGARVLIDLLGRGLNPKSGFKYGTKWRCYEGEIGMGHAPWLIVHPDKIPNDWNEACLASRLASGVNKKWLMPIIIGSKIEYLSISRPPADARWSSPR